MRVVNGVSRESRKLWASFVGLVETGYCRTNHKLTFPATSEPPLISTGSIGGGEMCRRLMAYFIGLVETRPGRDAKRRGPTPALSVIPGMMRPDGERRDEIESKFNGSPRNGTELGCKRC